MNYKKFCKDTVFVLDNLRNVEDKNFNKVIQKVDEFNTFIRCFNDYDVELDPIFIDIEYTLTELTNENDTLKYTLLCKKETNSKYMRLIKEINHYIEQLTQLIENL